MNDKVVHDPAELMESARRGDREAFGKLYELYFTPVYRYIYYKTKNKEVCNDLVQDVFTRVFASIERYANNHTSPLPFFLAVARNAVIDYWRKKHDVILEDADIVFPNIPDQFVRDPETDSIKKEEVRLLHRALSSLQEEHQKVIRLRFIDQRSTKEIAQLLNKSEEAIRQIQCRALKGLRKALRT